VKKTDIRWIFRIIISSIILTVMFTLLSTAVLEEAGYILTFGTLFVFIFVGIVFDMVGVAVMAADETPFHSMAAHRTHGAKEAIRMVKNADRVSSLCNDVVGDITEIISGTTMAVLAARMVAGFGFSNLAVNLAISSIVVGLTIGGKAFAKSVALHNNTQVVLISARVVYRVNWVLKKLRLRRT